MNWDKIKHAVKWLCALAVLGLFSGIGGIFYLSQDLPKLESLEDYKPAQATRIYSDDGHLVAYIANQRRTVIPMESLPKHVSQAFLAAEDDNFFDHQGISYSGLIRSFIRCLSPSGCQGGGGTITMQVVRGYLLTPEQTIVRKINKVRVHKFLDRIMDDIFLNYLKKNKENGFSFINLAKNLNGNEFQSFMMGQSTLITKLKVIKSMPKIPLIRAMFD